MCGIIGYVGYRNATDVLIDCLKRLEYRGYDSSGIGVLNKKLSVYKEVGEIKNLEQQLPHSLKFSGIGHTRWATHGEVTKENAHPHLSCNKRIGIVHNGIIENFRELRKYLEGKNHTFRSETDSEVIVHMIEELYEDNIEKAVLSTVEKLEGSFALVILSQDDPGKIIAVRNESPLVIGIGDNENFVASDIPAFLPYTERVRYLHDKELCILTTTDTNIFDLRGESIKREVETIKWNIEDAEKSGYPHFMLKEIYEQPQSLSHAILDRVSEIDPLVRLDEFDNVDIDTLTLVACGTSYYAALMGKYLIEELALIPVQVRLSSEYRYFGVKEGMVIGITQSGETADTLGAIKEARKYGCSTGAITNVPGSSITRLTDSVIFTRSGPEIGVAATKTFTSQVLVLFLLALKLGISRGVIRGDDVRKYVSLLKDIPLSVQKVLEKEEEIKKIARWLKKYNNVFFIGRGINHPLSLEGALKLKEISYIHAEGFAAGELKHGPFALLTPKSPVVAIVTNDVTRQKMLSNIGEIKARKSPVVAIADENDKEIEHFSDFVIRFPALPHLVSCIPISVIQQLLAYHVADLKKCSIDKPRNLAKSVTVE